MWLFHVRWVRWSGGYRDRLLLGVWSDLLTEFIFLGSKITADADCSHEIKRCLLLGRKAITNLESILKSRDITLPTKGPSSHCYGF